MSKTKQNVIRQPICAICKEPLGYEWYMIMAERPGEFTPSTPRIHSRCVEGVKA